jgi:hypothetical protein
MSPNLTGKGTGKLALLLLACDENDNQTQFFEMDAVERQTLLK